MRRLSVPDETARRGLAQIPIKSNGRWKEGCWNPHTFAHTHTHMQIGQDMHANTVTRTHTFKFNPKIPIDPNSIWSISGLRCVPSLQAVPQLCVCVCVCYYPYNKTMNRRETRKQHTIRTQTCMQVQGVCVHACVSVRNDRRITGI